MVKENKIIDYLKKNKVEGFFYIPGEGVVSLFSDKKVKAYVLDELRTEIQTHEVLREKLSQERAYKAMKSISKTEINVGNISYV